MASACQGNQNEAVENYNNEKIFVCENIGFHYRRLGMHLGLSPNELADIDANHQSSSFDRAAAVITAWTNSKGDSATLRILLEKLRKMNLNKIADDIVGGAMNATKSDEEVQIREDKLIVVDNISIEWRKLGLHLGLPRARLDQIGDDNRQVCYKADAVIEAWEQQKGNEATREDLLDALRNIPRNDIVYKLGKAKEISKKAEGVARSCGDGISNTSLNMDSIRDALNETSPSGAGRNEDTPPHGADTQDGEDTPGFLC